MFAKLQQYSKLIVYILGAAVTAGAGLIPVEWAPWIQLVAGVLTAFGIYRVTNAPATPNKPAA